MRYAIVESGGKQYLAREGQTIETDHLPLETGQSVEFRDVLLAVRDSEIRVGTPRVEGAVVRGTVVSQVKGPKVVAFRFFPKKRIRRKIGHRQLYTRVSVQHILLAEGAGAEEAPDKVSVAGPGDKKAPIRAGRKTEAKSSVSPRKAGARSPKTSAKK